jgi:hypothetical protein
MTGAGETIWVFGGPLAHVPAETAWTILAVATGFCAVFAWISYRSSVGRLGLAQSLSLMALRTGLLVALLLCLANPVRVERETLKPPERSTEKPPPPPRLAVVLDRSDSMTLADNRGRSRLDDALTNWRRLEKSAQTYFGETQYFSFAEDLRPAPTLEEAAKRTGGTSETKLYQSVSQLLKKPAGDRPDAIVVLTDGLDTSNESEAQLSESAIAAGVPVYFVAGNNRSARPDPFLRVREWRVPPAALPNSEFSLEVAFEAFSRTDRTQAFSLWQNGKRVMLGELALTTGSNLVPRNFPVRVTEPGIYEFALRLGVAADAPLVARAITRVTSPRDTKVRVLLHQGTLDWGFRHFTEALRTDPLFEFFTIITPDTRLSIASRDATASTIVGRLPDTAQPLAKFDCVVLAQPSPERITPAQQQALVEFVRGGGALFVMSPDAEALARFNGTALEQLLPVFPDPAGTVAENQTGKLVPFTPTEAGRSSPIFAKAAGAGAASSTLRPRFVDYAPVSRAKPGAEVLAIHPTGVDPVTKKPHILIASQAFGKGRGALLTTDTLWRWKLDEPSDSRVVETFWQQLLLAIGRPREPSSLRFVTVPAQVRVDQTVKLRIGGTTGEKPPVVVAKGPDGKPARLNATATQDAEAPWSVDWTPAQAGSWELGATTDDGSIANIFPFVVAEAVGEMARGAPALELLRTLAGETGGTLLTHEAPAAWTAPEVKPEQDPEPIVMERQHPRWNIWTLMMIALGLYAAELVMRRIWKLL